MQTIILTALITPGSDRIVLHFSLRKCHGFLLQGGNLWHLKGQYSTSQYFMTRSPSCFQNITPYTTISTNSNYFARARKLELRWLFTNTTNFLKSKSACLTASSFMMCSCVAVDTAAACTRHQPTCKHAPACTAAAFTLSIHASLHPTSHLSLWSCLT